jgi:integrase
MEVNKQMQLQYNITTRKKDKGIQYIISYKDASGDWRQKSKQGFTKVEDAKSAARAAAKELEKEFELTAALNREHEGKTFRDFSKVYVDHLKLYREGNTIIAYDTAFKHFGDLLGKEMLKIDSADIQGCVDKMVKEGISTSTIKLYLARLNTAFNYAIKPLKMIIANPVQNIDLAKVKAKAEKRALTQTQLNDLLTRITHKKYYMISLIAGKCGLRIGEILGLTWDKIDEKKSLVTVDIQWKHRKDGSYGFGDTKGKNSNRKVPMPPDVLSELEKYKAAYPINLNKRLFNYKNVTSICSDLKAKYIAAGYDIGIHELRHTYGTMLIANGIDFKTVAYLMGHDVKQTLETYSHVTDDMMESAITVINSIF